MGIQVFGITGTNGKTTVSYTLRNILKTAGKTCGMIGTIAHHIGEKEYTAINTTPGAKLLAEYFREMEEYGTDCCVMEISSHGLSQGRVDQISIDYAGFTNLSQDHLDYHMTMEEYFQAKQKLFGLCQKGGAVNLDDAAGKRILAEQEGTKLKSFSLRNENADYYGRILVKTQDGTLVQFEEKGRELGRFSVNQPGEYSVYNGLLAAALAREAGIPFRDIREGIETLEGVPGRFEVVHGKSGATGIVDFAHTPDALENLLRAAREMCGRERLICVFGCGGDRDRGKRRKMGQIAGAYSDYVIITSDNPRGEDPEDIAAEIEEGVYDTQCDYHVVIDRYQAIKRAVFISRKGDIIVLAGKGHEKVQIIGNEKRPFDDRQILQEEMEK